MKYRSTIDFDLHHKQNMYQRIVICYRINNAQLFLHRKKKVGEIEITIHDSHTNKLGHSRVIKSDNDLVWEETWYELSHKGYNSQIKSEPEELFALQDDCEIFYWTNNPNNIIYDSVNWFDHRVNAKLYRYEYDDSEKCFFNKELLDTANCADNRKRVLRISKTFVDKYTPYARIDPARISLVCNNEDFDDQFKERTSLKSVSHFMNAILQLKQSNCRTDVCLYNSIMSKLFHGDESVDDEDSTSDSDEDSTSDSYRYSTSDSDS